MTFCAFGRIMRKTKGSGSVKWFVIGAIALAVIFVALEIRDQILLRKIKKKEQETGRTRRNPEEFKTQERTGQFMIGICFDFFEDSHNIKV